MLRSFSLAAALVTAAAALLACSGASTSIANDPLTDAAAVPGTDAGGSPADGSVVPEPDGGTGSPDAGADNRIDPIALGRSWTYDVTLIGNYPICKSGSHVGQVLGTKVVDGKPSFQVQSFCPGAGTSSYAVTGDRVELYYANTWILSLDAPVQDGHTWTDGANDYSWQKVGQVTVPNGTYDDCWKAKPSVGESYTTFCRGVGPVRWHFVDATGNGYDAVLTAHAS